MKDVKQVDTRKVIGTVLGTIVFVCCILFFTYAYYNWKSQNTKVAFNVEEAGTKCTLGADVNVSNIGPVLDYQDGVVAEFSASNGKNVDITFALSLEITSISDNLLVESFKYVLVQDTTGGTNYDYDNPVTSGNFSTFQVGINVIKSDVTVSKSSNYSYQFIVYIDGNMYNDPNMQQNSLSAGLVFGNCNYENANSYIQKLYNTGTTTTVNIGGDTSNPTVSLNASQGIMLDNNGDYRYYGSDPNNYALFNGELWRIISLSNVKSDASDTTGEMRIKIIRDESIGGYSWDSSASNVNSGYGVNDWSKADLQEELNNLYYNQSSGTCYNGQNNATVACDFTSLGLNSESRTMIADSLYYLGGISDLTGLYADDYYNLERGTNVYNCSTDDGACPRSTSWTGKIGLMYPSDYGYAVDFSLCTKSLEVSGADTNCKNNNWLYSGTVSQWMLSSYTLDSTYSFYTDHSSYINANSAYSGKVVRPVVYLKSSAVILGGEGTSDNPYRLSILGLGNTVSVSFDNDGGTGISSAFLKYGSGAYSDRDCTQPVETVVPQKTGYSFKGYYSEPNGGGVQYIDSYGSIVGGDYSNDSVTLYAYFVDDIDPTCNLTVNSATYNTVKIGFSCSDDGGIDSYNLVMSEGSTNTCASSDGTSNGNSVSGTCTFDSFNLSTIRLTVSDENSNTTTYQLDSTQLDSGYDKIYDALNNEYETLVRNEKNAVLDEIYPVGSVYVSASSTSPATIFGGIWEQYATGRTLIGVGSNGTDSYSEANVTGGSETVTLSTLNLPAHTHTVTSAGTITSTFTGTQVTTSSNGTSHSHTLSGLSNVSSGYCLSSTKQAFYDRIYVTGGSTASGSAGNHTHTYTASGTVTSTFTGTESDTDSVGSGTAFSVMNPYIVTYIWRRTA